MWKDIYKQMLLEKATEIEDSLGYNDGIFQGGWFDSVILEMKNTERTKAITLA